MMNQLYKLEFSDKSVFETLELFDKFRITVIIKTKTRMTTSMKAKFKKPDRQTNIDKHRVTEYYSKLYNKLI